MKTLIISDLHSNIHALEAIWEIEKDSDQIICAGDLVDVGPYPKEIISWVQDHNVICVKGNHDSYIIDFHDSNQDMTLVNNKNEFWLQQNLDQLDQNDIRFLKELPETAEIEIDDCLYGITHAYQGYNVILGSHAFNKFLLDKFSNSAIERIIFGHTHRQAICHVSKNQLWVNPGSTSYRSYLEPEDKSTGSEYMTLIDGKFEFKKLEYNKSILNAKINNSNDALNQETIEIALARFPA
ncbi:MAG: metallophosphoesterase [Planctomycetota bacterium]|nr:MAG: metallophosphoesterase [Planctomycetota bacterium]